MAPHDLPLVTTVAAGLGGACVLGVAARRVGLSPIVGYLLAGIAIGPFTPGFVGDVGLAAQLAEIGVILLMFGVGLHFHLNELLAVRGVALPGALVQSAGATVLGFVVGRLMGWSDASGLVFGMALAVASTVVLMRELEAHRLLDTAAGHVAVGWLIVEDILTVVVLVVIPVLGAAGTSGSGVALTLALALGKLALLVALVLVAGARVVPLVLERVARLRSRELFTLTVLAIAVSVATVSSVFFGVSMALGAFLAGMVVGQTRVSEQAAVDALPLRDAFAVLFFVSVGMLFDPWVVGREPRLFLLAMGIVLLAKPVFAALVVAVLGYPLRTGLVVAVGLAQIGEFSFIVGEVARQGGLLPPSAYSVLVAAAILSISLNPALFSSLDRLEGFVRARPWLWRALNARAERRGRALNASLGPSVAASDTPPLAVVVGYGPVGREVDRLLREGGLDTVVVDQSLETVVALREQGRRALFGDASHADILRQAGLPEARYLVVTLPHSVNRAPMILAARRMSPACRILVRARYLRERAELEQAGADAACYEEAEAATALAGLVRSELRRDGFPPSVEAAAVPSA
jgi:CPA2 family monovalent cation:H+ antiporter-2